MSALAETVVGRTTVRRSVLADAGLIVLGSAVVAALAQVSMRLPFTPVPVTGQTLGVLVVGASLGATRGGAALILYLLEGAMGLPVFAEAKGGIAYLTVADPLHATGGYLWGFVAAASVVGLLADRRWDRGFGSALGQMMVGELIIFAVGIPWLAVALDVPIEAAGNSFNDALEFGLYPFVLGEIVKILLAAGLFPVFWRLLSRSRGEVVGRPASP
ncbi:MAG: biotin transporter BioY [Actinomycetota bacterium]